MITINPTSDSGDLEQPNSQQSAEQRMLPRETWLEKALNYF